MQGVAHLDDTGPQRDDMRILDPVTGRKRIEMSSHQSPQHDFLDLRAFVASPRCADLTEILGYLLIEGLLIPDQLAVVENGALRV